VTSQVNSIVDQANKTVSTIQQQTQTIAQNAIANASSQYQTALSSFQQNLTAQLSSDQQSESDVQACLKDQSDQYASIYNSTSK
jgi:F0F1-type ATP synthase membrane subunit b/b'